jgi:hypothetical protein
MNFLQNLEKLLNPSQVPKVLQQPQAPQAMQQSSAVPMGQAQSVDGYYPQSVSAPGGQGGVDNYLQPSYQAPQVSLNGGYQQGQLDMYGQPTTPLPSAADPLGWQALNRLGVVKNFNQR